MHAIFFYVPFDGYLDEAGYFTQLAATLPVNKQYFERIVLYTCEGAEIPDGLAIDTIVRLPSRQRRYPHFMRVQSWLHFLDSPDFETDTVFLDADVVITRPIAEVFARSFSLALSARPSLKTDGCISAGVIFAKHERKSEAAAHMEKIVGIAESLKFAANKRFPLTEFMGRWGVDELCLERYLGQFAERRNENLNEVTKTLGFDEIRPVFNTSITLLGKKFNNTDARTCTEDLLKSSSVLHFGGRPKDRLFECCARLAAASRPGGDVPVSERKGTSGRT